VNSCRRVCSTAAEHLVGERGLLWLALINGRSCSGLDFASTEKTVGSCASAIERLRVAADLPCTMPWLTAG
jgi:hypothetical protein